jgi:SNF2 family DNA or RNA helicase
MKFAPRPYQQQIIDFEIDTPRCAVYAGMGLGKTVATLTALDAIEPIEPGPALVVAPLRVAQSTWPDEAKKWDHLSHLEVVPIIGSGKERAAALTCVANVYTINYENIPWLVEYLGDRWPFTKIVADESTKLKGFRLRQGTQRAKALAKVAHAKASRFIELTGTPSPNGLVDLWGQAWFLDKGERLGRTFQAFADRWFRTDWSGYGLEPRDGARAEIEERLRDICLSLDARDHFDIAQPIVNVIRLELPAKARQLYEKMEREMFFELGESEFEAFNAASKTIKCLQLASGAIYNDDQSFTEVHDVKLQALEEVIEEASGMPVLVAYHFKSDLVRLQKAFPRGRHLDKDAQTIRDWNAGKIPILFAHPASAGHGLNLQDGGNILVFFSHWWSLEEHQQIIERIGPTRQAQAGHDRPVFVHHLVAADTVDELVMARRETKRELQDLLLEAMKRKEVTYA